MAKQEITRPVQTPIFVQTQVQKGVSLKKAWDMWETFELNRLEKKRLKASKNGGGKGEKTVLDGKQFIAPNSVRPAQEAAAEPAEPKLERQTKNTKSRSTKTSPSASEIAEGKTKADANKAKTTKVAAKEETKTAPDPVAGMEDDELRASLKAAGDLDADEVDAMDRATLEANVRDALKNA